MSATKWRVVLGVNLGHFDPARGANEARYARKILGSDLLGIEIGNEPDDYGYEPINLRPSTYGIPEYLREVEAYRHALGLAAPGVAIFGPDAGRNRWLTQMGRSARMFSTITQHYYPFSTCPNVLFTTTTPQPPTSAELLSPKVPQHENEVLNMLAQTRALTHRPTRITETGTGTCYGNSSASAVFASALWSFDWALRAASSGVKSLNFHGHLGVCGSYNQSPICAPNAKAADAGKVTARPEYYGILAASRLEGGRFVPTTLIASDPLPNLTAWATFVPGGTVTIAIDNLATSGLAQPVAIRMLGYTATEEPLAARTAKARSGVTLGGAQVTDNGRWRPRPETLFRRGRSFRVVVRPAGAIIVTLRRSGSRR